MLHYNNKEKHLVLFLLLILTGAITTGLLSCNSQPPYYKGFNSRVEITKSPYNTHEPVVVALGQCVGDGNQVITILNYEDVNWGKYSLNDLWVGQRATVQAIDPRTGATLLRFPGSKMQTAQTGDISKLKPGQDVIVEGEPGPVSFKVTANAKITSVSSLFIELKIANDVSQTSAGWEVGQGAAVTDKQGRILGLVGASYNRLVPDKTTDDSTVTAVSINSILELLSPDASQQPWVDGPAVSTLANSQGIFGYTSGILTTTSDYSMMTAAINKLVKQLGKPLDSNNLPNDYPGFVREFPNSTNGSLLTLVYPNPIELISPESQTTVKVNWIGLQWGRNDDRPNRLFYGFTPYLVAGGFVLNGDVIPLETSVGGIK